MTKALLHIGTPKTGTTSFQEWAAANRRNMEREADTRVYSGLLGDNHYEFGLLCKRFSRNGFGEVEFTDWCLPEWRSEATSHIHREVEAASAAGRDLLVTSEVLSLLRHDDELARLRELLGGLEVRAVVVVREPEAFLEAWRRQIGPGGWSAHRSSAGYSEPDSWLVDYGAMISAFEREFGEGALEVVSYEEALEQRGTVIPAIAEALEIDHVAGGAREAEWLNPSESKPAAIRPTSALEASEEISHLHRQLRLLRKERDGLEVQMDLKQEESHGLRETVGTLEQEILEARREVGEAERKLEESRLRVAAMTASLSWRATRPARAAKRVLGRLRPAWKPLVLTVLGVALAATGTAGLLALALVG